MLLKLCFLSCFFIIIMSIYFTFPSPSNPPASQLPYRISPWMICSSSPKRRTIVWSSALTRWLTPWQRASAWVTRLSLASCCLTKNRSVLGGGKRFFGGAGWETVVLWWIIGGCLVFLRWILVLFGRVFFGWGVGGSEALLCDLVTRSCLLLGWKLSFFSEEMPKVYDFCDESS